jgi:hypothetical protein
MNRETVWFVVSMTLMIVSLTVAGMVFFDVI